jgi:hypothetical protein
MRPVLSVSKATFCLPNSPVEIVEQSVCDRGRAGKPALEKGTYLALLFWNREPAALVRYRNKVRDLVRELNEWVGTLAFAGSRRQRQKVLPTTSYRGYSSEAVVRRIMRTSMVT